MTKCPPGVICIEQYMFLFCTIIICVGLYFIYTKQNYTNSVIKYTSNCLNQERDQEREQQQEPRPDILLNPYTPPLKPLQFINPSYNIKKMPINIKTQGQNQEYNQIGILTRVNGEETVLPLMGRPLITHRDKWNYYTMNDKNNMIKLPILFKNRSCTSEIGCDSVYDGDTIYVEGYKDLFRVTLYDNNTLEYIPYI